MKDIRVFPTAGRSSDDSSIDLGTNLVTEYNLSSIINNIIDNTGFVISDENDISNNIIEFNINGYYFILDDFNPTNISSDVSLDYVKIQLDSNKIKATISIDTLSNNLKSYRSLIPTSNENWDDGEKYTLYIYDKGSNQIPRNSRIHFNTWLDDGDLDS